MNWGAARGKAHFFRDSVEKEAGSDPNDLFDTPRFAVSLPLFGPGGIILLAALLALTGRAGD